MYLLVNSKSGIARVSETARIPHPIKYTNSTYQLAYARPGGNDWDCPKPSLSATVNQMLCLTVPRSSANCLVSRQSILSNQCIISPIQSLAVNFLDTKNWCLRALRVHVRTPLKPSQTTATAIGQTWISSLCHNYNLNSMPTGLHKLFGQLSVLNAEELKTIYRATS